MRPSALEIRNLIREIPGRPKFLYFSCLAFISIYTFFVFVFSIFARYEVSLAVLTPVGLLLAISAGFLCLTQVFSPRTIAIAQNQSALNGHHFWKYFGFSLIPLVLLWALYFPGSTSPDTISQWQQVQTLQFNDWHPVAHTLLIWLSTLLIKQYWFALLMQNLALAFAVAYLGVTLDSWGFPRWVARSSMVFIIINPATWNIMQYAWKDCAFAIFMLFYAIHLINIYLSEGKWLRSWQHTVYFLISFTGASLMRHNGIFATLPILLVLFFLDLKSWKRMLAVGLLCISLLALIKGPAYQLLKVETDPTQTFVESMGVPMTMMGGIIAAAPENLPTDVKAFLNLIATDAEWQKYYRLGDWNSVKFKVDSVKVIASQSPQAFLDMTARAIHSSPGVALNAYVALTDMVWDPFATVDWAEIQEFRIGTSLHDLAKNEIRFLSSVSTYGPFGSLFWCTGTYMLLMLSAALINIPRSGFKVLLLVVPMLVYNFGTMLLLSGADHRFFYYNALICVPIVLVLFSRKTEHIH
jgi:hypothetical protein